MECRIMTYSNSIPLSYGNHEPLNYFHSEEEVYEPQASNYQQPNGMQVQQVSQPQSNNQTVVYNQPQIQNNNKKQVPSSVPAGLTGLGVGVLGGCIAGALKKNPYMNNGVPTNTFAQLAYEKYLKKAPDIERKAYGQSNEVINQIDKMKNTDELKTLLSNNSEASKEVSTALNKTTEEYLSTVADTNLAANKNMIKKKLEVANQSRYQNMKNEISRAWNSEKRAFVKPDNMDKNTFKAITRTAGAVRARFIATYALIAGIVTGTLTFITHKIIAHRKERIHQ